MKKQYVDVQIMRVITPQANQNSITRYTCSNQKNEVIFNCFILCHVVDEASYLVYIMMTAKMNGRVFRRDLVLRDNVVITIGSYLHVIAPH